MIALPDTNLSSSPKGKPNSGDLPLMEEGKLASVSIRAVQVYFQRSVSREMCILPVFPVVFAHLSFKAYRYECVRHVFSNW